MLGSFETYNVSLSKASAQRLLSLYPIHDFTDLVRHDEEATAQYYRAAQMNRDIRFTCPVIDFTWHYGRHSASSIRLYEMNKTKFEPIFQYMGIPQWRVAHLSDIPYLMNEDVAAGGDNSPAQKELSQFLSGSAAAFAYSGDPNISQGRTFKDWPLAYPDRNKSAVAKDYPEAVSLYIIGGPTGNGQATTPRNSSPTVSNREKALAWEKIIERCQFINSIQEEIGV